jgi:hypothetical protein
MEVEAIKQAWDTGEFTRARLARIYDTGYSTVNLVVNGKYRHLREN